MKSKESKMEQTSPIQALLQQRTLLQLEYYTLIPQHYSLTLFISA